jgi:hypothetical protein
MRRVPRALWRRRGAAIGAVWAWRALRSLRRDLKVVGLEAKVAAPPRSVVSRAGDKGVRAVLTVGRATCLERALIVQRLLAQAGRPHEVAIGVNGSEQSFEAHAWVVGHDAPEEQAKYTVLTRLAPG